MGHDVLILRQNFEDSPLSLLYVRNFPVTLYYSLKCVNFTEKLVRYNFNILLRPPMLYPLWSAIPSLAKGGCLQDGYRLLICSDTESS